MKLKGRLNLIANMVPKCELVCDIGTDHAYIPIYLIEMSICKRAIATDVREGPLKIANGNIISFNLDNKISVRKGYGISPINENECDTIIISGMGGTLINEILTKDLHKARLANALIIQPMNAICVVREWLYTNGFNIYDEALVNEGEKIYNVITAKYDGVIRKYEEIFYYIAQKLIEKSDILLEKYIKKEIKKLDSALNEMSNKDLKDENIKQKYLLLKSSYETVLSCMNQDLQD